MAYQPINLGEIYAQAQAIKGAQQKAQFGALQLQEAQKAQADQQGIDQALTTNPNSNLSDLIKAGGGMAGVQASTQVGAARTADLTNHYRQMYTAATQVANSDNPLATIQQVAPQFPQQYDQVHGQGAFAKLAQDPAALKQQAAQVAQDSLAGLVDPDKQFQAHQMMVEDHYKQEGPGGELARNQNTIAAENARAQAAQSAEAQRQKEAIAAENARAAASRSVTIRGQDLEASSRGIPAGYERDPNNPGALRPIVGGPHDPNATSAGMDSRSSVMFNRVAASANEAVQALKNIAELPVTTSTGWFGSAQPGHSLMESVKGVLAQKVTSQEAQDYKTMIAGVSRSLSTIETAGLAPNGSITHSMDSITLNEGDSQLTKLRKLAETRQIIEKGIEPNLSNPKLAPAQRQLIEKIVSDVQQAIPFTQHDITQLQQSKNPNATLLDFARKTGLPSSTGQQTQAPVKIATDADYAKLPSGAQYVAPDGTTRTKR
jgi:hypothetical protein